MSPLAEDGTSTPTEVITLAAERERASFDVRRMAALWLGSQEAVAAKEKAVSRITEYPVYDRQDLWRNSKYERYVRAAEKTTTFWNQEASGELKDLTPQEQTAFAALALQDSVAGAPEAMFMQTIRQQGSEEQCRLWLPAAATHSILGTYCQAELGHSSDLDAAGIETQAIYNREKREFEIHTPTIRGTKWCPQALGRTATHAVVCARLLLPQADGTMEDKGPKAFLVQLRDLETHENLPGLRSGDVGPTIGAVDVEQGWCTFDHFCVPRAALLCRYGEVAPDGTYVALAAPGGKAAERKSCSTAMCARSALATASADHLGKACAIAVRYLAVRRQLPRASAPMEDSQALDCQVIQARTMPWIATAYALRFMARKMMAAGLCAAPPEGRAAAAAAVAVESDAAQAEASALVCGLKATMTKRACDGIEELRRACGSHGALHFAGLGELYGNAMLAFTGEGENDIIIQQLTRWLLRGQFGNGLATFLLADDGATCPVRDSAGWLDTAAQVAALQHRARHRVAEIQSQLEASVATGKSWAQAAQSVQWNGVQASLAVCETLIAEAFAEGVRRSEPELQPVLRLLCSLFCLDSLEGGLGDLLMDGYLVPEQASALRAQARCLLEAIRPDAVSLVDALGYADLELNSAIGSHDGDVHRRLLEWAEKDPMNEGPVVRGWREHWRPATERARRRLEEVSGLSLSDRGLVQCGVSRGRRSSGAAVRPRPGRGGGRGSGPAVARSVRPNGGGR